MLISLSNIVIMGKIQKNICTKVKRVGLINIDTKESQIRRHSWKWSIHSPDKVSESWPVPAMLSKVAADLQRPICLSNFGSCSGSVKLTLRCNGFLIGIDLLPSLPRIPRGSPTTAYERKKHVTFYPKSTINQ